MQAARRIAGRQGTDSGYGGTLLLDCNPNQETCLHVIFGTMIKLLRLKTFAHLPGMLAFGEVRLPAYTIAGSY